VFPVKAEVNQPLPMNGLDRLGSKAKYKNPLDPILIPRLAKKVHAPFVYARRKISLKVFPAIGP